MERVPPAVSAAGSLAAALALLLGRGLRRRRPGAMPAKTRQLRASLLGVIVLGELLDQLYELIRRRGLATGDVLQAQALVIHRLGDPYRVVRVLFHDVLEVLRGRLIIVLPVVDEADIKMGRCRLARFRA